jgi:hypothetical protein
LDSRSKELNQFEGLFTILENQVRQRQGEQGAMDVAYREPSQLGRMISVNDRVLVDIQRLQEAKRLYEEAQNALQASDWETVDDRLAKLKVFAKGYQGERPW